MSREEIFEMTLNPEILEAARKLAANSTTLPAEIPGFPGLFVAASADDAIDAIGAFVAPDGVSYKIGTREVLIDQGPAPLIA